MYRAESLLWDYRGWHTYGLTVEFDRKRSPGNYARENVQLSYFRSVGALVEKKERKREINREIIIHKRLSVVSFLSLQKQKKESKEKWKTKKRL